MPKKCFLLKAVVVSLSLFSGNATLAAPNAFASQSKRVSNVRRVYPGFQFEQWTKVLGNQTVTVCAGGIKIENTENHMSMLCVSPYDKIISFSPRTRRINVQPYANFDNQFARSAAFLAGATLTRIPLSPGRVWVSDGFKQVVFATSDEYAKRIGKLQKLGSERWSEPKHLTVTALYLPIAVDRKALDWFSKTLSLPVIPAFATEVQYQTVSSKKQRFMRTSAKRKIDVSSDDLKAPVGFKAVSDLRDLIQDESATDAMRMMMRD